MISITEKSNCCGCGACAQKCPRQCIVMKEDAEGFLYPKVNQEECVECGLCDSVCPMKSPQGKRQPLLVIAAKNTDLKVREASSSGGVFHLLAQGFVERGGVVFGAEFDEDWSVRHNRADNVSGIHKFMGSKYSQSRIDTAYIDAEKELKAGREVLFSGTPCQIAGLKNYLVKDYSNLTTVAVVCHGVPSPAVWRSYMETFCNSSSRKEKESWPTIQNISFRDKRRGWKRYGMAITTPTESFFEYHRDNLFMKGFLSNIYLRPSCYSCIFKAGMSKCDIILGDFWGINTIMPDFDDDKGVSLVLAYSQKGKEMIQSLPLDYREAKYEDALKCNPCIETSVSPHSERSWFYKKFPQLGVSATQKALNRGRPSLLKRMASRIWNCLS